MEDLDLVHQKSSNSQSSTHSRPAESGSKQAIHARAGHPNRVVSPSGGLPSNMQQVGPASNRPICHKVQQQVAIVCVTSTRFPGHSSGCTDDPLVTTLLWLMIYDSYIMIGWCALESASFGD